MDSPPKRRFGRKIGTKHEKICLQAFVTDVVAPTGSAQDSSHNWIRMRRHLSLSPPFSPSSMVLTQLTCHDATKTRRNKGIVTLGTLKSNPLMAQNWRAISSPCETGGGGYLQGTLMPKSSSVFDSRCRVEIGSDFSYLTK
ncbi:hypothetical protein PIB30_049100 [Stylosanthes scabra]|uniref:Uncharacterized protein n=1 Tax=Stylosanthes scabra TaxID=79078 RepID=A0ABU6SH57_9FABA|nr:hypothetical protein [Stylosanthes scabra]